MAYFGAQHGNTESTHEYHNEITGSDKIWWPFLTAEALKLYHSTNPSITNSKVWVLFRELIIIQPVMKIPVCMTECSPPLSKKNVTVHCHVPVESAHIFVPFFSHPLITLTTTCEDKKYKSPHYLIFSLLYHSYHYPQQSVLQYIIARSSLRGTPKDTHLHEKQLPRFFYC